MTFLTTKSNKSTLHCHGIAETRGTPGNWGGKAKFDFLQEISTNYPPRAKKDKKECALPWCLLWWTNSTCGHSLPKKRTNKTMHAVNILCRIISICVVTQLQSIRRGPDSNICLSRQGLQLPLSTVPISRYESSTNARTYVHVIPIQNSTDSIFCSLLCTVGKKRSLGFEIRMREKEFPEWEWPGKRERKSPFLWRYLVRVSVSQSQYLFFPIAFSIFYHRIKNR